MHKVVIGIELDEYYAIIDETRTIYYDTLLDVMLFLKGYSLDMPFQITVNNSFLEGRL